MSVAPTFAQLWEREELPIRNALYLADGRAFTVALDEQAPGGLTVKEAFDLDAVLAEDPEWVTSFVISKAVELPNGGGSVCCGEGSWGAEGIFARLEPDGRPVWAVYLERSNPFVDVQIRDQVVRFQSSSGVAVSATLAGTDFVPVPWPQSRDLL